MPDDYLWDRSGVPDPEVRRLEELLGRFSHTPLPAFAEPPRLGEERAVVSSMSGSSRYVLLGLAAALVAAIGAGFVVAWSAPRRPSWEVASLRGAPTVASSQIGATGRLKLGDWLETGAGGGARISVGTIGRVDVDAQSRVRLSSAREGNYRLSLERGTMHAMIWAPPGQFLVDTPSSTAVDLGCAYTLRVASDGSGMVEVTAGWVGFEWRGKESFIPAGAVCATRPRIGPGTPHYTTASPEFASALTAFDFGGVPESERAQALATILASARPDDAVTLWHLLQRVPAGERARVFDRLAQFVPVPAGVSRDGVLAGQRDMLDLWWDELGLGSMRLWRGWQQRWRDLR